MIKLHLYFQYNIDIFLLLQIAPIKITLSSPVKFFFSKIIVHENPFRFMTQFQSIDTFL